MPQAVVALGGNLGDVPATFRAALRLLREHDQIRDLRVSSLYSSDPMGAVAGGVFINAASVFETTLEPLALLDLLQAIELRCGRMRDVHWGPRSLDLDLIFFDSDIIADPRLIVPHPHAWYRRFVLAPIEELCPDFPHPVLQRTIRDLYSALLAPEFELAAGGAFDDDQLRSVVADFANVTLITTESPPQSQASIGVWFAATQRMSESGTAPLLPPNWLLASVDESDEPLESSFAAQFIRDVLTAARGAITRSRTMLDEF